MGATGEAHVAEGAEALGYRDPGSGYDVVVSAPHAAPALWREYLAGAQRSYRAHGVEHALDYARMCDGRSSSLLFAVLDERGAVIGGIRCQGPFATVEQTHALEEWADHPGQPALRAALERMVPEGLVELKAAWVADDIAERRQLVACLSRTPPHAASVLGARFAMGTAAAHAVPGWAAAGGIVAADVPAVAYPDERYRTRLVYWDRSDHLARLADGERASWLSEAAQLRAAVVPDQVERHVVREPVAALGVTDRATARQDAPPSDRPIEKQ